MMKWAGLLCTGLALLAVPCLAAAGPVDFDSARAERRIIATRATGPIVVDGQLDEPAWEHAPIAHGFIQNDPKEGQDATFDTTVRVLYDDDSLYFGVFAKDDNPTDVIVNELKKDFNTGAADVFEIILDTFHDERNGYQFAVNAGGARWDAQVSNEGRETNANWDGIWFVQTRIGNDGWYAEIAIPFKTLKFASADPQTWGINFRRQLRRYNESSFWAPVQRIHALSRVSMAGTLEGLQGLKPGANLRVKPYGLTSRSSVAGANAAGDVQGGFDVKYGVTSGLTWDFTVNTDFSQVEADEQQVNLTRFSLFFPEKRDFFLENSGVFQFGGGGDRPYQPGGGGGGGRQNAPADPVYFFTRRIGLADSGDAIPILGGTRLTGRQGAYSIGLLNIQQRTDGPSPSTNFTAIRVRRDILRNSDIGVMFLNKSARADDNRVAGLDANFRFFQNLNINLNVVQTSTPAGQVNAKGDDNLQTKAGFTWRNRTYEARAGYQTVGTRFNDEMGFIPRTGVNNTTLYGALHLRPTFWSRWVREAFPHWQFQQVERRDTGQLDSRYMDFHFPFNFQNSGFVEPGVNPNVEVIVTPFTLNARRGISIRPGRYEFNEYFVTGYTNPAARLSYNARYGTGPFYDGYKRSYSFSATSRVSEQFTIGATWARNDISLPGGGYVTDLVTGRVNYSFSTRMFVNALLQYNTDARQWSSNVRFNFIHRPLSDFFLVYNERRDTRSGEMQNRALIAKMTYLMAF